jgi:hypothetical protein
MSVGICERELGLFFSSILGEGPKIRVWNHAPGGSIHSIEYLEDQIIWSDINRPTNYEDVCVPCPGKGYATSVFRIVAPTSPHLSHGHTQ